MITEDSPSSAKEAHSTAVCAHAYIQPLLHIPSIPKNTRRDCGNSLFSLYESIGYFHSWSLVLMVVDQKRDYYCGGTPRFALAHSQTVLLRPFTSEQSDGLLYDRGVFIKSNL